MMKPDLIIFDCDGVLIDSEVLSCRCLSEVLAGYGISLGLDQALDLFLGRSATAVLDHYQALRGVGATPDLLAQARKLIVGGILETAQVMKGSLAAGKTLAELDLRRRTGATVLSVVRNEQPLPTPDGPTRLEAEDLVVLYGPHEAIDRALGVLEPRETGG